MERNDSLQLELDKYSFADLHALRNELEKALAYGAINEDAPKSSYQKVYKLNLYVCNEIGNRLRMLKMYVK